MTTLDVLYYILLLVQVVLIGNLIWKFLVQIAEGANKREREKWGLTDEDEADDNVTPGG